MAFSNSEDQGDVMSEINMVPLIDIMLVLLIIFIITVPVIKQSINIALPQVDETVTEKPKEPQPPINLGIAADGAYFIDTTPISDTDLEALLAEKGKEQEPPSLHISGDKDVRYERIALAMEIARRSNLQKIAFVTDPEMGEIKNAAPSAQTAAQPTTRGASSASGATTSNTAPSAP